MILPSVDMHITRIIYLFPIHILNCPCNSLLMRRCPRHFVVSRKRFLVQASLHFARVHGSPRPAWRPRIEHMTQWVGFLPLSQYRYVPRIDSKISYTDSVFSWFSSAPTHVPQHNLIRPRPISFLLLHIVIQQIIPNTRSCNIWDADVVKQTTN
jgi:hypothetical protein